MVGTAQLLDCTGAKPVAVIALVAFIAYVGYDGSRR